MDYITSNVTHSCRQLFKILKTEECALTFSQSYELIVKAFKDLYHSDLLDDEEVLEGELEIASLCEPMKITEEVCNTFLTVYFRYVSISPLDFKSFRFLHSFMINLPATEVIINSLQFLVKVIGERLRAERGFITCPEVLLTRFHLIQTLAIFCSLCETTKTLQPLLNTYNILIEELNLLENTEKLMDEVDIEEAHWISRNNKRVLILGNRKCVSLFYPEEKQPRLHLYYIIFYYLWKIAKINILQNIFKSHEKTLQVIVSNLTKNSIYLHQANDKLKQKAALKIFNENMILLRFLKEIFEKFPEFKDYLELYLESKFKFIVVSFFSLLTKIKGLEIGIPLSRIFHLLKGIRKVFGAASFKLHKEVFDFFLNAYRFKDVILKEVTSYYCQEDIPIEWLVKIIEVISLTSNKLNDLEILLRLLYDNISKEMKNMSLLLTVVRAIKQVWPKLQAKEVKNEIGNFIYKIVKEQKIILKDIEWYEESCFVEMLIAIGNKGVTILSELIFSPDERILNNQQEVIYNCNGWIELMKNNNIELLYLIKNLSYHNKEIKKRIEDDLIARAIKLGKLLSSDISNSIEIDKFKDILLEISFEPYPNLIERRALRINNQYAFGELLKFLYSLLLNESYEKIILNHTIEIIKKTLENHENYKIISSVTFL